MAYKVQLPIRAAVEQFPGGSPISEKVVTAVTAVTSSPPECSVTPHELSAAYRRYWSLPESEPLETFRAAYLEIATLEAQADPPVAWHTLREAATAYYSKTGICPFCLEPGPLHLPAEQIALELSGG